MSKKCTTLCLAAIAERKSLSSTTSTIDIALNHDVTPVGQPTGQTPKTFSIIDMTEKVVELDICSRQYSTSESEKS